MRHETHSTVYWPLSCWDGWNTHDLILNFKQFDRPEPAYQLHYYQSGPSDLHLWYCERWLSDVITHLNIECWSCTMASDYSPHWIQCLRSYNHLIYCLLWSWRCLHLLTIWYPRWSRLAWILLTPFTFRKYG